MEQTLIILADMPKSSEDNLLAKLRAAALLDILTEANRLAELNPEMDIIVYHDSADPEEFLNAFYAELDQAALPISRHLRKFFDTKLIYKTKPDLAAPQLIYTALNDELSKEDVEKVVLINCSCPMLLGELIDDAFYYTDYFHLALGGIKNGGIYLIAADQAPKELLEAVEWNTETTFKQLTAKAEELGLSARKLDLLNPIRTVEDMRQLYPKLLENGSAPNTCKVWQSFAPNDNQPK